MTVGNTVVVFSTAFIYLFSNVPAEMPDVFESHIFLDGGIIDNALGDFAIQLVTCIGEVASADEEKAKEFMGTFFGWLARNGF
jgi:hypothetical protein